MHALESVVERIRRSSVQVGSGSGGGSGIVWNARGTVVTNAHVIRGETAHVDTADGRRLRGVVSRSDRERDLAVLETNNENLEPAAIADTASLRAGQIVIAIGNPLGVTGAIAVGMIHTVGPLDIGSRHNWIQADIRLAPGNSGGLLAAADGCVIGMNTMIFNGLGLAIPSSELRSFVDGEQGRLRLGIEMIPVREGLMVVAIEQGSLAESSGIELGDIVRSTPEQLRDLLSNKPPSFEVEIPILRRGRIRTLRVHAAEAEARAA